MVSDLNLLKSFYYVALEESVSKAALKLHISQPAVSQNLKQLESEIGFSLFVRTNKGVKMTNEAYEIYIKYHLATCERADLTGYSHHTLDIFRKE